MGRGKAVVESRFHLEECSCSIAPVRRRAHHHHGGVAGDRSRQRQHHGGVRGHDGGRHREARHAQHSHGHGTLGLRREGVDQREGEVELSPCLKGRGPREVDSQDANLGPAGRGGEGARAGQGKIEIVRRGASCGGGSPSGSRTQLVGETSAKRGMGHYQTSTNLQLTARRATCQALQHQLAALRRDHQISRELDHRAEAVCCRGVGG